MNKQPLVAGVDIGGTKILAGVANARGEMLSQDYRPTQPERGVEVGVGRIVAAIEGATQAAGLSLSQLSGVGVAIAGLVDSGAGILITSPNMPGWQKVPLAALIGHSLGLDAYILNDASAAVLGEQQYGAGREVANLVYITVSTGIGGGIITDGKLYVGAGGFAGELGHMTIEADGPPCACGSRGCLETLASGTAMAREAQERIERGEQSSLIQKVGGDTGRITARDIAVAARRGDLLARQVIARAADYLGIGLANIVNIFNPELIIIGGGVAKMGKLLLAPAVRTMRAMAFPEPTAQVRVVRAQLGDRAGVLGAVAFALQKGE